MNAITKAQSWSNGIARANSMARVPPVFRPPMGGAQYFSRGYRWQQAQAMQYWVYVAVNAWMGEVAGGEPPNFGRLLSKQDQEKRQKVNKGIRRGPVRKALGGPKSHEEFEAFDRDHPCCKIFRNPNEPDVAFSFWSQHIMFKKLMGQSHWWCPRGEDGWPKQMWVLPPHWMQLVTGNDGQPLGYMLQSPWGQMTNVPWDEVVSFYETSPLNRYEGLAPTQAGAMWIDLYESMTTTRLATFKNGASPQFHVKLDERYDPDAQFIDGMRAQWTQRFQGENRAGQPLFTGPGIDVVNLGFSPSEIQYIQGEEQIRDMILMAFGVPRAILGNSDNMTYGSVQGIQAQFRKFKVNSELTYTGQVVSEKIMQPVDPDGVCFWDERITDDDLKLRQLQFQYGAGSITPNEIRAEYGLEPFPHGGDDPILNGNPLPWMTGEQKDEELDRAFHSILNPASKEPPQIGMRTEEQSMGEGSGSSGGFLVPTNRVSLKEQELSNENDELRTKLRRLQSHRRNGSRNGKH